MSRSLLTCQSCLRNRNADLRALFARVTRGPTNTATSATTSDRTERISGVPEGEVAVIWPVEITASAWFISGWRPDLDREFSDHVRSGENLDTHSPG
jgi:hypothetical protein